MKRDKVAAGALVLLWTLQSVAGSLSFKEVWSQIESTSPAQEAAHLQVQSLEEARARADRHWLPKVYVDARTYQTNDPGQSFFGLLEQRKVTQSDFDPNALNHPGTSTYTRGALGLDLPLFEGNMKVSQSALYDHSLKAQKMTSSQIQLEQYSQVGIAYGSIIVLQAQIEKLNNVSDEIQKLLKRYQIGQKSNPVGYSGLLGLKSLANRISGLLEQYKAQEQAYYKTLKEMGVQNQGWTPEAVPSQKFVEDYLSLQKNEGIESSYQVQAQLDNVKAAKEMAKMERARYMPRIGAFAESYTFNGSRDTANGYSAGLYLQWNLFDPADFGRYKEARIKAMAGEKQVQALIQQQNAEKAIADETEGALRSNLKLLQESDQLLNEQMKVSTTLFRNGSITALQLVEILNRRADLISQQNDLELSLIKTASSKITKYEFQIPFQTGNGGSK